MRRTWPFAVHLVLSVLPVCAEDVPRTLSSIFGRRDDDPAWTVKPRYELADAEFADYLHWLGEALPSPTDRLVRVTDQIVGASYRANAAMFSRTEYDCVTLVEQALATALASSWDDYFRLVARLRYAGGRLPFGRDQFAIRDGKFTPLDGTPEIEAVRNRNQFIISEWNANNQWCLEDITAYLGKDAIKPWLPLHHIARVKACYAKQGLAVEMPDVKVIDCFIPREAVPVILPELRSGDIVEVIRGSWENRFCDHMGILVVDARWDDPEGSTLYMVHAVPPKVRRETLVRFLRRFPEVQGLKFLRLRDTCLDIATLESHSMEQRMKVPDQPIRR